jgi:signal transduction histidine kinase
LLATVDRATNHLEETDWVEFTDTIRREGRRIDSLVDDLFFLARSDERREEMRREEVDLDDILDEEARRVRQITTLRISTSGVQPTRVWGDPPMLRRLVRNVVDNALRFANEEVSFSTRYVGPMAEICVHDDGTGVDVAQSERLFQRFVRTDAARSRASGGTGLGLPIVAEITLRHGGEARFITVESGSTMRIRVRRY